ncbi:MerR family transcriptional regulator [Microcoleus sp. Z1_C4]|uniref:MerR family transcriptional regulator n=1 Tax=Microcoleus sp. Z1_C4 TaxID=3055432 RepID=UPI002FCEB412
MKQGLFISQLSRQLGIPVPTIRYYERLGLLKPPERTQSQYRIYSEEALERLRFIQKAKHFGLSLDELKKLIDISAQGTPPCASLKAMVKQHLDELECRIEEMVKFRHELANRYSKIEALVEEESTTPNNVICGSTICRLIEQENDTPRNITSETVVKERLKR